LDTKKEQSELTKGGESHEGTQLHVFSFAAEEIGRGDDAVGGGVALQLCRQLIDVAHIVEHDEVQQKCHERKRERHVEPSDSVFG
jgi:hypothetical protein